MNQQIVKFADFSQKATAEIQPYAKSVKLTQFMDDVAMAFASNNALRKAVQTEHGQRSATNALKAVASLGFSLNPALKECALVTFKNGDATKRAGRDVYDVTFIPMKDGYIRKATESGMVAGIFPQSVYKNDGFELRKTGDGDDYKLDQNLDDRGEFRGCFAMLVLKNGRKIIHYMSKAELEAHRAKYCSNRKLKPLWWDQATFPAMGEKTCIKYVCTKNGIPIIEPLPEELQDEFSDDPDIVEPNDYSVCPAEEMAEEMEGNYSGETEADVENSDRF